MQDPIPKQNGGKSNIIAATILASGLIVSALIVAKPMRFSPPTTPPITFTSVESQFIQEMRASLQDKQHLQSGQKTTLGYLDVEKVEYSPETQLSREKSYSIHYMLQWVTSTEGSDPYPSPAGMTGGDCILKGKDGVYTGQCSAGDNEDAHGRRLSTPVVDITVM